MPGEPSDAESSRMPRTNSPMKSAVVCQPLAIRPPNGPSFAASGSMWNGCGSKRCRELDDVLLGHLDRAELGHVADREVLPVAHRP